MLDGKLVRTICDISTTDENFDADIIVVAGTEFIWDDSTTDQNVDGVLVFVDRDEVELVDEIAPIPSHLRHELTLMSHPTIDQGSVLSKTLSIKKQ